MPRFSAEEVRCCKRPITAAEIQEMVNSCARSKSPYLDGLLYKFYGYLPDLFDDLLADVYHNW